MDTILIELKNEKALQLLMDLEALSLIRLIRQDVAPVKNLSKKYAGSLDPDIAENLQNHISSSREEWQRPI